MFKTIYVIFTVLILFTLNSFAQTGSISGKVTDAETGEILIGVNILVINTTNGTSTDLDGVYEIGNLVPGKYSLRFSYVSYSSTIVNDIAVKANENTIINLQMNSESTILQEVIVNAELLSDNENSILKIQKYSADITDVVSAELIKKNGSSDGVDVLKRMSGVTIADGKYAFIRGVSDRYNNTLLNGSNVPGTDPEKKSFSYDLIPSSVIENITTSKTFTPDKPADFSGGLVQINTVEFPSQFFLNTSVGSGYNTGTSFKQFTSYHGGKIDIIGLDDGTRKKPSSINGLKAVRGNYSDEQLREIGISFRNNWGTYNIDAPININYKLALGDKLQLGNNVLGLVGTFTYSNSQENKPYEKTSATFDGPRYTYSGNTYNNSILWGAMLNTSLKFNPNNKISFKNIYNHSSDDDIIINEGSYEYTSQYRKTTALRFVSRSLFSSQLLGEHMFKSLNSSSVKWNLSYGKSRRDEPDARKYVYGRDLSEPDQPMKLLLDQSWTTRFFSNLDDNLYSFNIDFTIRPFKKNDKPVFKTGILYNSKERYFDARIFGFRNLPGGNFIQEDSILFQGIEQVFQPSNFDNNFLQVIEITKPSDSYKSDQTISGSFLMMDMVVFKKLRVVGGVRYERSEQNLISKSETNQSVLVSPEYNDWLPGINATYKVNELMNIRAAYSKTLARPEFREMAPFSYYDFLSSELVIGNTRLQRTLINNFDLKFEFYPDLGELFAVSLFYKKFQNPIEQVFIATSGFEAYRSFANVSDAQSYGLEFEMRKSLDFLTDEFDGLSFIGNLSLIKSKVKINESQALGFASSERPMQGQSEYIFNIGLYYENEDLGLSGSAVYNKVGDRIAQVGFINIGDIIEKPRDQIDASISKIILANFSLGLSVKDFLGQDHIFIQRRPEKDIVESKYLRSPIYSVSLSYTL